MKDQEDNSILIHTLSDSSNQSLDFPSKQPGPTKEVQGSSERTPKATAHPNDLPTILSSLACKSARVDIYR